MIRFELGMGKSATGRVNTPGKINRTCKGLIKTASMHATLTESE